MARTINEIYQTIIVEKNNMNVLKSKLLNADGTTTLSDEQDLLNELTNKRAVSIWKLWAYMTAVIIWIHEGLWDVFKTDVEELIDTQFVGTIKWLITESKAFQFGDTITVEEPYYHPHYSVLDESKQIIGSANAVESGTDIYLKVRRKDTNILTQNEMSSFIAYLNQIKFAGQRISVLNFEPDNLKLYFNIYYNGTYDKNVVKSDVENAIYHYIENIEFDSFLNISALIDNIQQIDGVEAVFFDSTKSAGLPTNTTQWIPIQNYYYSVAGWNIISPDFVLSDTITYISK